MKSLSLARHASVAVALAVIWMGAGCSTYEVKLDAISRSKSPPSQPASYAIRHGASTAPADSLRYQEGVQQLKTALSAHGLWEAPDAAAAELIIDLDFGVDPPRVHYEKLDRPILGIRPEQPDETGSSLDDLDGSRPVVNKVLPPVGRELIGVGEVAVPTVVREKHLSVSCHENRPAADGRPALELWRVSVCIDDERSDIRECLPVLASAVMDHLGTTTDGVTDYTVEGNDDAVQFIKSHR